MGNFWASIIVLFGLIAPLSATAAGKARSCKVSTVEISFEEVLEFENFLATSGFFRKHGLTAKEVWIKAQSLVLHFGFKDLNEFSYVLGEAVYGRRNQLPLLEDLMAIALNFEGRHGSTFYADRKTISEQALKPIANDFIEYQAKLKDAKKSEGKHAYLFDKEKPKPRNIRYFKKNGKKFEKMIKIFLDELSFHLKNMDLSLSELLQRTEVDEAFAHQIAEKLFLSTYGSSILGADLIIHKEYWEELQYVLRSYSPNQEQAFAWKFVLQSRAETIEEMMDDFHQRPSFNINFLFALNESDRDGHIFLREKRFHDDRIHSTIRVNGKVIPTITPGRNRPYLEKKAYDTYYKTDLFWDIEFTESFFQMLLADYPILRNPESLNQYIQSLSRDPQAIRKLEDIVRGIDSFMLDQFGTKPVADPEVAIVTLGSRTKLPSSYYSFSFIPFIEIAVYSRKNSEFIAEEVMPIIEGLKELQKIIDFERYDFSTTTDKFKAH